jgi:hypothetical protein
MLRQGAALALVPHPPWSWVAGVDKGDDARAALPACSRCRRPEYCCSVPFQESAQHARCIGRRRFQFTDQGSSAGTQ